MSLHILDRKSLPTPKIEEWKYTNLERALGSYLHEGAHVEPREILIHKTSGKNSGEVEEILCIGNNNIHHQLFLKIYIEDGASATVIERHEGTGAYWKNIGTEIVMGANSRLNHIRLQMDSDQAVHTEMVSATMESNSYLNSFSLNMGGKLTRHDINVELNGSGAECMLNGVNLLNGEMHGDTTIFMEHVAPNCKSNQFYRSILDDSARGVFQGKVYVHSEAQKTDGYQRSNTIMLSPKTEMDTKPELEIYADDVKCSHGTTTGALDEEPLFYLLSRGLTEAQARMLLVQAFVDEVIDKVADKERKQNIKDIAEQWLKIQLG